MVVYLTNTIQYEFSLFDFVSYLVKYNCEVHVQVSFTCSVFAFQLISRGEIIDTEFERKNNEPVKILTNSLQEKLSPSGRYVVFYVDTSTNEVVADSIKVSVTPRCKGQDVSIFKSIF